MYACGFSLSVIWSPVQHASYFLLVFEEAIKTIVLFMISEGILVQWFVGDECVQWLVCSGLFLHSQVHHWRHLHKHGEDEV